MNFIELKKYDGTSIFINKYHVSCVVVYSEDYTTIKMNNGQTIEVGQSYEELKSILSKEEKNACSCK